MDDPAAHDADAPPLELWTVTDIARELGVSRVTVHRWRTGEHHPRVGPFPQPLTTFGGRAGVWDARQVRDWRLRKRLLKTSMMGACLGRYRQTGGNISQVARELGKDKRTIVAWLTEMGEYPPFDHEPKGGHRPIGPLK